MKKILTGIVILAMTVSSIIVNPTKAEAKNWPKGPSGVSAEGAIVMDMKSGMILYEKNMDEQRYPASITKIMTTLVALENSSLTETVKYSSNAVLNLESGASNMGLKPGEKITMEQSLYGVMLPSANEACLGVAEHVSGSVRNFVKLMNDKAASLGCKGTHFNNPNGLWEENHYTTPHDMALIMRAAMQNPMFRTICSTKVYEIPKTNKTKQKRYLLNHHAMINSSSYPQYSYEYCIGGKTGYTSKSQATLVTAAKKGDMELVCVVMKTQSAPQGEPNIYTDTIKLFNYCFENFAQHTLNNETETSEVRKSMFTNFSPFYANEGISIEGGGSVILPKGASFKNARKSIEYFDKPQMINGKKSVGKLVYTYSGKEVGGGYILYNRDTSVALTDSIDMNEWFKDAVEKANTPSFPWKMVIIILIVVAFVSAGITFIIYRLRTAQVRNRARKHYRRSNRGGNSYYRDYKRNKYGKR